MASPAPAAAPSLEATFQKALDFFNKEIFSKINAVQNMQQGDSCIAHRLLSAYLVAEIEPGTDLPEDIVEAARNLTPEQQEAVRALGEIARECREVERALQEEWAALPEEGKSVIKANAQLTRKDAKAFSDGMPLWQSLMFGISTAASIAWDSWTSIKVPDSSLFPRVIPFLAGTVPLTLGYLIAPGANWKQFYHAIFQDRVVLGIPQRIVLSYGIQHLEFYKDKPRYIAAVGTSSVSLMMALNMPGPILEKKDDLAMSKIGAMPIAEDEQGAHAEMTADMGRRAHRLDYQQKKLKSMAEHFLLAQGLNDGLSRIGSRAKRTSDLLLRASGQYIKIRHEEHGKKAAIVGLWDSILTAMVVAARENPAQIGALIPYIAFAQRRMLEVLFDTSKGAEEMINLFARSGATALYQLFFISGPLIARGPKAFDEVNLKAWITASLTTINLTVMQYTPHVMFKVGDGGKWTGRKLRALIKAARRRQADDAQILMAGGTDIPLHDYLAEGDGDEDVFFDAEGTDFSESDADDEFFDALAGVAEEDDESDAEQEFFDAPAIVFMEDFNAMLRDAREEHQTA